MLTILFLFNPQECLKNNVAIHKKFTGLLLNGILQKQNLKVLISKQCKI